MMVSAKHDACGSGPVVTEHEREKIRAVCCYCWTQTRLEKTEAEAKQAWLNGEHQEWREPRRATKR